MATVLVRAVRAVLPVLMLYVAKLIIDEVVLQTSLPRPGSTFNDWLESGRLARLGGLFALGRASWGGLFAVCGLALVGENGAGKTTLAKLLARLYDPQEGRILLDGHDLREYDVADLHARIGVIFQDFVRFHFTAGENIAIGRVDARAEAARILSAAQSSRADEVITRLPKGYEQPLGKRFRNGIELSGGEWQKGGLACRAHAGRRPLHRAFQLAGGGLPLANAETATPLRHSRRMQLNYVEYRLSRGLLQQNRQHYSTYQSRPRSAKNVALTIFH